MYNGHVVSQSFRVPQHQPQLFAVSSGMAPRVGPRLRHALRQFRVTFDVIATSHPEVQQALVNLEECVAERFPLGPNPGSGRTKRTAASRVRSLQNQLQYARARRQQLQFRLDEVLGVKQKGRTNRISPEFLTKVSLSAPTTSSRGFATAWQDLVGVGDSGCSRTTVCNIRNAFTVVLKDICCKQVCNLAASMSTLSSAAPAPESAAPAPESAAPAPESAALSPVSSGSFSFHSVAFLHIHDEASLRLRSQDSSDLHFVSRGRRSKVQQHVTTLHWHGQAPLRWFAELHPLANNTARVLASSLNLVLRDVVSAYSSGLPKQQSHSQVWFLHILVGDGVNTNEAAAKIILVWVKSSKLSAGIRYFLILVKCAKRQTNLAVGNAVSGRAALLA